MLVRQLNFYASSVGAFTPNSFALKEVSDWLKRTSWNISGSLFVFLARLLAVQ